MPAHGQRFRAYFEATFTATAKLGFLALQEGCSPGCIKYLGFVNTRTITLEEDAYEQLHAAMLPGETPSAAVRRLILSRKKGMTGAELREYIRRGGSGVSEEYLDSVEEAVEHMRRIGRP